MISALVVAQTLYDYRNARVLIMAPTRPLILQHRSSFQSVLRLPESEFALLTGKASVDYRLSVWKSKQRVIFATPEVVRNDLLENRLLDLDEFALVVFDECHRSVKEYAYTEVAGSYLRRAKYPIVLGMTASPGSDPERISMVCRSLSIEKVDYRSEKDPDVSPYINPVSVQSRLVTLPTEYLAVSDALREMLNDKVRWLQGRGYLKRDSQFISKRSLIEIGSEMRYHAELTIEEESGPAFSAISVQSHALTLLHMLELLESQGSYTLRCFMDHLAEESRQKKSHRAIVSDPVYSTIREILDAPGCPDHPKVKELVQIVSEQVRSNQESRILVFTQYRDTATHLVDELNRAGEGSIRAERFVGQASKSMDRGLTQSQQAALIEDLRAGHVNTLCSTSIAEEGLDIPEVDLVVFFEPIPSEIRYIQRRGRTGRNAPGRVIILAAEGTTDMVYLQVSERRAEMMRNIISSINQKLTPIERSGTRPAVEPMDASQLAKLERMRPKLSLSTVKNDEYEKNKVFGKMVNSAKQDLYVSLLEGGLDGIDEETLRQEMEEIGHSASAVSRALESLEKDKRVSSLRFSGGVRFSLMLKNVPDARMMSVEVKKVVQGGAIVVVDDEREAMLDAANYAGPRELIKKGRRFHALCELYKLQEGLNLNVRQVIRVES